MRALKHSLIFYFFAIACFLIFSLSMRYFFIIKKELSLLEKKTVPKLSSSSYFFKLKYYLIEDEKPSFLLNASELKSDNIIKKTTFFNPVGKVYSDNFEPIDFESATGLFDEKRQILVLDDNVTLLTSESKIKAKEMRYFIEKDLLNATENVESYHNSASTGDKINIFSDRLKSYPRSKKFYYKGNAKGKIDRKRRYEEDVDFRADNIDFLMDDMTAKLNGAVKIERGQISATSLRGEIFLNNYNKKLKYYVMYDDVKVDDFVKDENGTVLKRKAFSEKLEGVVSEDKVILTGYPKVFQGKDIVKGNIITIRDNNDVIEVDDANTNMYVK